MLDARRVRLEEQYPIHPCQALADVMGWTEWCGEGPGRTDYEVLRSDKFSLCWGFGALARA